MVQTKKLPWSWGEGVDIFLNYIILRMIGLCEAYVIQLNFFVHFIFLQFLFLMCKQSKVKTLCLVNTILCF